MRELLLQQGRAVGMELCAGFVLYPLVERLGGGGGEAREGVEGDGVRCVGGGEGAGVEEGG